MGIKKFIKSIKDAFDIKVSKKEGKKAKMKELIKELKAKRKQIEQKIEEELENTNIEELQEDYEIITLQIKKSKKILRNLDNN